MITRMDVRNENDNLIMHVMICPTRDTADLPTALETLLKNRRTLYMANCPRQYQHLVDLREWYWVLDYDPTLDPEEKALEMLVDSRYRVVLLHTEQDLYAWNGKNKKVHFIEMPDTWNTWLCYPVGEETKNDYLSQVLAGSIEMRRYADPNDELDPMDCRRKMLYDDAMIARLVQTEYIPISDILYRDIDKKEKVVLIRHHETLYQAPIEETHLKHYLIDFPNMEAVDHLYMIGDMVKYDQTLCVVVGVNYGEIAGDPLQHLYTIVPVRRNQTSEIETTGIELRRITATEVSPRE